MKLARPGTAPELLSTGDRKWMPPCMIKSREHHSRQGHSVPDLPDCSLSVLASKNGGSSNKMSS